MTNALLVIDLQNDDFPGGKFPLWNTDAVLHNIVRAVKKANAQGIPVIHIQYIATSKLMRVSRDVLNIIQSTTTMRCCNMRPRHCVLLGSAWHKITKLKESSS